jgi:hypothetical protein
MLTEKILGINRFSDASTPTTHSPLSLSSRRGLQTNHHPTQTGSLSPTTNPTRRRRRTRGGDRTKEDSLHLARESCRTRAPIRWAPPSVPRSMSREAVPPRPTPGIYIYPPGPRNPAYSRLRAPCQGVAGLHPDFGLGWCSVNDFGLGLVACQQSNNRTVQSFP